MFIAGKISTFINANDRLPSTSIKSAITTTEIGRLSARRTSHIMLVLLLAQSPRGREQCPHAGGKAGAAGAVPKERGRFSAFCFCAVCRVVVPRRTPWRL